MPAERFLQRWSRLKTAPPMPVAEAAASAPPPAPAASLAQPGQGAPQAGLDGEAARRPTLDDVAQLHAGSDYAAFVARGVDQSVRRGALKKLFADPHFNIGDGLDLYMGDYNQPDPIPAAMMSALRHTQSFFAQAYPDKQADPECPGMPGPAIDDAGSAPTRAGMEPPMADANDGIHASAPSEDQT